MQRLQTLSHRNQVTHRSPAHKAARHELRSRPPPRAHFEFLTPPIPPPAPACPGGSGREVSPRRPPQQPLRSNAKRTAACSAARQRTPVPCRGASSRRGCVRSRTVTPTLSVRSRALPATPLSLGGTSRSVSGTASRRRSAAWRRCRHCGGGGKRSQTPPGTARLVWNWMTPAATARLFRNG